MGWKMPRGYTIKSFLTPSPPHARPIHPWHFTLAFCSWVGMYSKRVQTDGREVHAFNSWGRGFALSFIRHEVESMSLRSLLLTLLQMQREPA